MTLRELLSKLNSIEPEYHDLPVFVFYSQEEMEAEDLQEELATHGLPVTGVFRNEAHHDYKPAINIDLSTVDDSDPTEPPPVIKVY